MFNSAFKIVFIIEVIAINLIRSFYTFRIDTKVTKLYFHSKVERLFMVLEVVGMLIPFVYCFTSTLDFANYQVASWVGWFGTTLFFLAILLLWRAHHDLGEFWVMDIALTKDHRLIKTGVYRFIRHPLYASHMIWAIAQVMMLNNWIAGYSFIIIFLPHYIYRVGKEEKMLVNRFGEEYDKYIIETGRLFPKIIKR
jgi:protein-S-isoprenylcysteine O-methyltransferase Ste14